MHRVLRRKNRHEVETVRPDGARDVTQATESATRDVSSEEPKIMVVGPPGCCGCVDSSVQPTSRRKR